MSGWYKVVLVISENILAVWFQLNIHFLDNTETNQIILGICSKEIKHTYVKGSAKRFYLQNSSVCGMTFLDTYGIRHNPSNQ